MNVRNDVIINSPNNKNETCTEFVIDDITKPFMLNGTTEVGEDYTFSAWIKSSEESSINIYGESIPITNEWKRKRVTFNATGRGIRIYFDKVGTYYFYKSQLELGKVMSDASPSPEDIKASLEVKINKENLISEINASADIIRLTGDRLIIDSKNLQVAEDGTITAKNGNFSGTIKGSDGEFTEGFSVKLAVDASEFFELKMKTDDSIKSFFVGIDSSDDMGKSYLKIRPSYLDILSLYLNISGGRTLELCSGGQITLDSPSVEMLSTLYSSCYVSIPNGTLELNGIKISGNAIHSSDDNIEIKLIKDGDYYYFRPNEVGKVVCGSEVRPWRKIYTEAIEVTANKPIFKYSYDNPVSYATNCHINSEGKLSRTTNTSSKTIKHDIVELSSESELSANKLYDVNVYQFKYNDDIITDKEDARYGRDLVGFIIEDLNKKYPIAVDKPSEDVREWSWNAQYLIPPMLKLIQEQNKRINILERKINDVN